MKQHSASKMHISIQANWNLVKIIKVAKCGQINVREMGPYNYFPQKWTAGHLFVLAGSATVLSYGMGVWCTIKPEYLLTEWSIFKKFRSNLGSVAWWDINRVAAQLNFVNYSSIEERIRWNSASSKFVRFIVSRVFDPPCGEFYRAPKNSLRLKIF